uniref:Secreted protein n=1 Tax=Steinernema glaseri TaxID=37863 RepID=A0A1I8AG69_9BILA
MQTLGSITRSYCSPLAVFTFVSPVACTSSDIISHSPQQEMSPDGRSLRVALIEREYRQEMITRHGPPWILRNDAPAN